MRRVKPLVSRSRSVSLIGLWLLAAACSSGESILNAGNDPAPVTTTTPSPTTGVTTPGDSSVPGASTTAAPTQPAPTTTITPLASLPPCPVAALDAVDGPVQVTFWHGLTGETDATLVRLTDAYNASQSKVRIVLQNQGGYNETIDKYVQSGQSGRPDLVMFPEYHVQQTIDSGSVIPIGACVEASGFDTTPFRQATLAAYETEGVQWAMPFNVSNPVLYYNRRMFEAAGLDPDQPPRSLEELRAYSQQIVDSGVASFGIALDTGTDSGGGWFIEQWFANAGELYADNGNGRLAPATRVLYDSPAGVELLTYVQQLIGDGLAVNVGDNPSGQDNYLRLANQSSPAAMTIGTSAALGTLTNVLDQGLIPAITGADLGVGAMPGPSGTPTALVGGASLFLVDGKPDEVSAAAWDYIQYLVSAQTQAEWAVGTGYVPVREDALGLEPLATRYAEDPRYRVAYDQLIGSPDDPALRGPILGPQREVRTVTARAVAEIFNGGDVADALARAAVQSNALIADYAARN